MLQMTETPVVPRHVRVERDARYIKSPNYIMFHAVVRFCSFGAAPGSLSSVLARYVYELSKAQVDNSSFIPFDDKKNTKGNEMEKFDDRAHISIVFTIARP